MTTSASRVYGSLRKLARVAAVLFIAGALGTLIGVHIVRARATSWLEQVGQDLQRYAPAEGAAGTTVVRVNGLSFELSTQVSTASVDEVLDEAESACKELGAGFAEATPENARIHELLRQLPSLDAILRTRGTTSGVVACLTPKSGSRTLTDFADAASSFVRDLDPSAFGSLRYMHASRAQSGTLAVHVVSRGPLPLRVAFPEATDAPGDDPAGYPRPERSRRLLSVSFETQPSSLHLYRMPQRSLEDATRQYTEALRSSGYEVHPHGKHTGARHVAILSVHDASHSAQITLERIDDEVVLALAKMP